MSDIKHINPLYLACIEAKNRLDNKTNLDISNHYSGGMIESYTKSALLFKNHIVNSIRYKGSMYHTSYLDKLTYTLMRREAERFYGLMSLDVGQWITLERYAFLKLFIKYRLKHIYKKEVKRYERY